MLVDHPNAAIRPHGVLVGPQHSLRMKLCTRNLPISFNLVILVRDVTALRKKKHSVQEQMSKALAISATRCAVSTMALAVLGAST